MTKLFHACGECSSSITKTSSITKIEDIVCPRCETTMNKLTACHMICPNCGAHLDCSDKGSFW